MANKILKLELTDRQRADILIYTTLQMLATYQLICVQDVYPEFILEQLMSRYPIDGKTKSEQLIINRQWADRRKQVVTKFGDYKKTIIDFVGVIEKGKIGDEVTDEALNLLEEITPLIEKYLSRSKDYLVNNSTE